MDVARFVRCAIFGPMVKKNSVANLRKEVWVNTYAATDGDLPEVFWPEVWDKTWQEFMEMGENNNGEPHASEAPRTFPENQIIPQSQSDPKC